MSQKGRKNKLGVEPSISDFQESRSLILSEMGHLIWLLGGPIQENL